MMDRAFKLGQSNEIVKDDSIYDLHNDYLPTAIVVDIQNNLLRLTFKKISAKDGREALVLEFHDINVLKFDGVFGESSITGLDEMGFKSADDYNYEWLATESQSSIDDHMILRFDGGGIIRVHSASVDVVECSSVTAMAAGRT